MSVTIRLADKGDILALAELIEEIERFCGSTQIQPLAERQSQVEQALRISAHGLRPSRRRRDR